MQLIDTYSILLHFHCGLYLGQVSVFLYKRVHFTQRAQAIIVCKHKIRTTNTIQIDKYLAGADGAEYIQFISRSTSTNSYISGIFEPAVAF